MNDSAEFSSHITRALNFLLSRHPSAPTIIYDLLLLYSGSRLVFLTLMNRWCAFTKPPIDVTFLVSTNTGLFLEHQSWAVDLGVTGCQYSDQKLEIMHVFSVKKNKKNHRKLWCLYLFTTTPRRQCHHEAKQEKQPHNPTIARIQRMVNKTCDILTYLGRWGPEVCILRVDDIIFQDVSSPGRFFGSRFPFM